MAFNKKNGTEKKEKTAQHSKKPLVLSIYWVIALALGIIIILHKNLLANQTEELWKKIVSCAVLLLSGIVFTAGYEKIAILPFELYQNRRLIWKLAKNDFKKRYAGSNLGVVWGLIQPLVTVGLYYMVFGMIFPNQRSSGSTAPFVLFLTAGLVPWFFFSEALNMGTNALIEYNYLVKKVVFKISILPIIKVVAALFTHAFFIVVVIAMAALYGYYPSLYTLQVVYYSFCLFVLVLALCYMTCAVCVFFRDLTQLITIVLQVGMWATPIMWDINSLKNPTVIFLLKINPLVYIVNGYRGAIYEKTWFFQDFFSMMYFWVITAVFFGLGALVFKRLKVHFADVL